MLREALLNPSNAHIREGILNAVRAVASSTGLTAPIYCIIMLVANNEAVMYHSATMWEGQGWDGQILTAATYEKDTALADICDKGAHPSEPQVSCGYDHAIVPLYDATELRVLVVVAGPSASCCNSFARLVAYAMQIAADTLTTNRTAT